MRDIQKGDYIGFTFAGIHTSQLGLYATSNGDRYIRNLSPNIKDRTAENTGGFGSYYFGVQKTNLQFNIDLAFDSVTEVELREIQSWLSSDISELIFDERPYIKYYCKISSVPQMNYIPFYDEENIAVAENLPISNKENLYNPKIIGINSRIYKGEMTLQFTAYEPYGYSVYKWLDKYDDVNKVEWALASGLKETQNGYDTFSEIDSVYGANVYNGGNLDCDFILKLPLSTEAKAINNFPIVLDKEEKMHLNFSRIDLTTEKTLIIDTRKRLIYSETYKLDEKQNLVVDKRTIENNCLIGNDFFKLPRGFDGLMELSNTDGKIFSSTPTIEYNYRYI